MKKQKSLKNQLIERLETTNQSFIATFQHKNIKHYKTNILFYNIGVKRNSLPDIDSWVAEDKSKNDMWLFVAWSKTHLTLHRSFAGFRISAKIPFSHLLYIKPVDAQ